MSSIIKKTDELDTLVRSLRAEKKKIVFTNGVFDIIHRGHVVYLQEARKFGDVLIVGMNSDASVRRIKGERRPVVSEDDRAFVLSNLKPVDYVAVFDEDDPYRLIKEIQPDVLVKGSDWEEKDIIGSDIVRAKGGTVQRIEFVENNSSTRIIEQIIRKYSK